MTFLDITSWKCVGFDGEVYTWKYTSREGVSVVAEVPLGSRLTDVLAEASIDGGAAPRHTQGVGEYENGVGDIKPPD